MKRAFDFFCSTLALLLLSPLLIPVVLILKMSGEGEIFYRQKRIGKNGQPFFITKFATMLKDSPIMGTGEHTLHDDPRVLPFGRFLRKSKINELPQIWDIWLGKMSFVGPRPTTPSHHAYYPDYYSKVMQDHLPGLTGVGSIVFRDEESVLTSAKDHDQCYRDEVVPYKAELEKWYKENRNLWMDITLMFITAWVVARPQSDILFRLYPSLPRKDLSTFGR